MSFNKTDPHGRCGQMTSDLGIYVRLITTQRRSQREVEQTLLALRERNFTLVTHLWVKEFQATPSELPWHVLHPLKRRYPHTLSPCVTILANNHLDQVLGESTSIKEQLSSAANLKVYFTKESLVLPDTLLYTLMHLHAQSAIHCRTINHHSQVSFSRR